MFIRMLGCAGVCMCVFIYCTYLKRRLKCLLDFRKSREDQLSTITLKLLFLSLSFFFVSFVLMQRCNALAEQKEVLLSFVTQKAQTPGQVRNYIICEHIICDQVGFLNCGLIKMQAL